MILYHAYHKWSILIDDTIPARHKWSILIDDTIPAHDKMVNIDR